MAGIGIIANPHSKLNKRNPRRQHLLSYIAGEKGRLEVTNNLDELRKVAQDFRHRAIKILAINGGDGTISRTITAFIDAYQEEPLPKIALLGGGTMNMLADNLGIKGSPEENLFRLIEQHSLLEEENVFPLNTIKIGSDYGFLFADGTSARFLDEFYKNKTSALGSASLVIKAAVSALVNGSLFRKIVKGDMVSITPINQENIRVLSLSVLVSSVPKIPHGIQMFPEVSQGDEGFNVLCITLKVEEVIRKFFQTLLFKPYREGYGKIRFRSSGLQIKHENSMPYTLDGELFSADSGMIKLEKGPEIQFLKI
ncbi:MAG: diacylglycerol kinase family protein [Oligoflexales bacterium]